MLKIIQSGEFENKPLYKLQLPSGEFLKCDHPRSFGYTRNWVSINDVMEFAKQENLLISQ